MVPLNVYCLTHCFCCLFHFHLGIELFSFAFCHYDVVVAPLHVVKIVDLFFFAFSFFEIVPALLLPRKNTLNQKSVFLLLVDLLLYDVVVDGVVVDGVVVDGVVVAVVDDDGIVSFVSF